MCGGVGVGSAASAARLGHCSSELPPRRRARDPQLCSSQAYMLCGSTPVPPTLPTPPARAQLSSVQADLLLLFGCMSLHEGPLRELAADPSDATVAAFWGQCEATLLQEPEVRALECALSVCAVNACAASVGALQSCPPTRPPPPLHLRRRAPRARRWPR